MKKLILFLTAVFMALAYPAIADEIYGVKKGECLSVIGRHSGVSWREIAKINGIGPPKYIITVGQKLRIPRPAVAVRTETAKTIITVTVKQKNAAGIETVKTHVQELVAGENANITINLPQQEEEHLVAPPAIVSENKQAGAAAEKKKEAAVQIVPVANGEEQTVTTGPAVIKAQTETAKNQPVEQPAAKVRLAAVEEKVIISASDKFDAFMSVGGWTSTGNKNAATGGYGQAKIRYRPFSFNLFDHEVGIGGFLMGETGSGSTGKWDFRWNKLAAGPSFKVYGDHWDASTDLGWSRDWSSGASDKQITDSAYLLQYVNLEQRRWSGSKWLPQTELVFSATIPYDAFKESTKTGKAMVADNKSVYGLDIKQSIYDFKIGDHARLTPGVLLGGGFEADKSYGKIGSFVKLGVYNQDILTAELSIKDKSAVDGLRWYGALMLNVGGAINAIKAAGINEAKPADLVIKK